MEIPEAALKYLSVRQSRTQRWSSLEGDQPSATVFTYYDCWLGASKLYAQLPILAAESVKELYYGQRLGAALLNSGDGDMRQLAYECHDRIEQAESVLGLSETWTFVPENWFDEP